jgi:hypothetical protein
MKVPQDSFPTTLHDRSELINTAPVVEPYRNKDQFFVRVRSFATLTMDESRRLVSKVREGTSRLHR